MAQFRTTADILDSILRRAGEVTNGNSAYETDALEYLNRVHHNILAGGSVFNMEVDEAWTWAHSKIPIILELEPAFETGTVSVTNGSEAATFSSAPTLSKAGWHIRFESDAEVYKILTHAAGGTAFELDAPYVGTTNATASHKTFKLDYELVPQTIHITAANNKINFTEGGLSTEYTATLAEGAYTPAQLATELDTKLVAAGSASLALSTSYDAVERKFSLALTAGGLIQGQTLGLTNSPVLFSTSDDETDLKAQQFTPATSFSCDQIAIKLSRLTGVTGTIEVSIQGDTGSNVPDGISLGSATIDAGALVIGTGTTDPEIVVIDFSSAISLTAATNYFIVLNPEAGGGVSNQVFIGASNALGSDSLAYIASSDTGSSWGADTTSVSIYREFRTVQVDLKFGTGTNAAISAAAPLGFDDENVTLTTSLTSVYCLGGISRLIEPFRIHRNSLESSQLMGVDKVRFEEDWPVHKAREGLPSHFTRIKEDQDGRVVARFNTYPKEARRVEVNYIPVPRDLKDNAISRPLLPRKDVDTLEYGAAFYIMMDKEDSKADTYGNLAKQGLESMQKRNRNELRKVDALFGQIVPRPEYLQKNIRRLRYGYTAGD